MLVVLGLLHGLTMDDLAAVIMNASGQGCISSAISWLSNVLVVGAIGEERWFCLWCCQDLMTGTGDEAEWYCFCMWLFPSSAIFC
jgi:hypothetical protein